MPFKTGKFHHLRFFGKCYPNNVKIHVNLTEIPILSFPYQQMKVGKRSCPLRSEYPYRASHLFVHGGCGELFK